MSTESAKISTNTPLASTYTTERSVLLAGALLLHRVEACEHEGSGEPFAIDFAIKLTRRLNDSESLEPQRQLLVAELKLVHLRHDEFPRRLLPLLVDIVRFGLRALLFAHGLLRGLFGPSCSVSALAPCSISSYAGRVGNPDNAPPNTISSWSRSRNTPC